MNFWYVIRVGIGSVACTSLLMACADGRGTNGFKSYRYSKEELIKAQAARDAKLAAGRSATDPQGGTDDTTRPDGDVPVAPAPAAPVEGATPVVPGTDRPLFAPLDDAARGKLFGEQRLPQEPEQQVAAQVKDLTVTIDTEIARGQNPAATNQIKGITVIPSGPDNQRLVAIQAVVSVGGQDLYFDASDVPVKFLKESDQIPNILFLLKKPCEDAPVAPKNALWAAAKCRDQKCRAIEVVLSFEAPNGRANGVVIVEPGRNAQGQSEWQITKTNIGRPKTFVQAQADIAACVRPDTAPAETRPEGQNGGGAQAPADQAGSEARERAERERAETAEVEKKRCAAVQAEGFSCDDSPVEIAQMRNARARAAAAAASAPAAGQPAANPTETPATDKCLAGVEGTWFVLGADKSFVIARVNGVLQMTLEEYQERIVINGETQKLTPKAVGHRDNPVEVTGKCEDDVIFMSRKTASGRVTESEWRLNAEEALGNLTIKNQGQIEQVLALRMTSGPSANLKHRVRKVVK